MAIRWLSRSRASMQRLGFCKAILSFCEIAVTHTQMADTLRMRLEDNKFSLQYDEKLATWLKSLEKDAVSNSEILVSLQKLYIHAHPSQTGWLSRKGFDEYVEYLPFRLGLLTSSYEPTDMGVVLAQGLMTAIQREALERPSSYNPLLLDRGERIFFFYNLLAADGDLLLPFCEALINQFREKSFNYVQAGSLIPNILEEIINKFAGSAYTPIDREQINRMESTRQRILREIEQNIEKLGSGSRREQTTIPRLEWLVDLGIVERVESRTWRFSQDGVKLLSLAQKYREEMTRRYPENVIGSILDSCFFSFISSIFSDNSCQIVDGRQFLSFIHPAYERLSGVGGYSLLRPSLLYANIMSLLSESCLFIEYDQVCKIIEDIYQADPTIIHYTIDRFNTDYQIKLYSK